MTRDMRSISPDECKKIDDAVMAEAKEANKWMDEYRLPQSDRDIIEKYRSGFCGQASDVALKSLSELGFDTTNISKVNGNNDETHYYLQQENFILEPSYKQFLYSTIMNPRSGELKEASTIEQVDLLNELPGVFSGTTEQFVTMMTETLAAINRKDDLADVLNNYKTTLNSPESLRLIMEPQLTTSLTESCDSGEVSPKTSPASFDGAFDEQPAKSSINPDSNASLFEDISETGALVKSASPEAHTESTKQQVTGAIQLEINKKALMQIKQTLHNMRSPQVDASQLDENSPPSNESP